VGGELVAETEIAGAPCSKTVMLGASEIEIAGAPGAETETLGPFPGLETTILGASSTSLSLSSSWCPSGSDTLGTAVCWD